MRAQNAQADVCQFCSLDRSREFFFISPSDVIDLANSKTLSIFPIVLAKLCISRYKSTKFATLSGLCTLFFLNFSRLSTTWFISSFNFSASLGFGTSKQKFNLDSQPFKVSFVFKSKIR